MTGWWWLEHFLFVHILGINHPNWLIFFGLKPPTSKPWYPFQISFKCNFWWTEYPFITFHSPLRKNPWWSRSGGYLSHGDTPINSWLIYRLIVDNPMKLSFQKVVDLWHLWKTILFFSGWLLEFPGHEDTTASIPFGSSKHLHHIISSYSIPVVSHKAVAEASK